MTERDGKWWGDQRLKTLKAKLREAVGIDLLSAQRFPHGGGPGSAERVIVVGAGFAGLATAHFLRALDFNVSVYEASDRVGGRVFTNRDDFVPRRNIEFGAELIGWNHALWRGLADTFGLTFDMLPEPGDDQPGPWELNTRDLGQRTRSFFGITDQSHTSRIVTGEEAAALRTRVDGVVDRLAVLAEDVMAYRPWHAKPGASTPPEYFDKTSFSDWLDRTTFPDVDLRVAMEILFSNDNVMATEGQSLLGVVAQIAGGGCQRFDPDTEVMRCAEGNDALATQLALGLSTDVELQTPVSAIGIDSRHADRVQVRLAGRKQRESADFVVIAVPPSVYGEHKRLEVEGLRTGDWAIQLGPAVKHFARTSARPWDMPGLGDTAMSTEIGETWEATPAAMDAPYELSLFAGGAAANRARDAAKQSKNADAFYDPVLAQLFPGFKADDTHFQSWSDVEWIWCGYSAMAVGEMAKAKRLAGRFKDRIVFAGEHTCPAFYGYMEGALESGLLATHQILEAKKWYATNGSPITILDALEAACAAGTETG